MKRFLLILGILLMTREQLFAQANDPYNECPAVNIAIVRAGGNAAVTNPYYLYNVNTITGTMTQVSGGPYKDPVNPALNMQVNGIGVNRKDGYIYGLASDGTITTARFVRMDKSYGVTDLGSIPSPASGTGLLGIVNPAAGAMDTAGNFYFSAFTINPLPVPSFDKFYIGKISNVKDLNTGPATVVYYEVDVSAPECAAFISTFQTDPANSGLKDFCHHAPQDKFYTYATYKLPGATAFSAQLFELSVIPGSSPMRYKLSANTTVNMHTAETSGVSIDREGRLSVLFTDGSFGRVNTDAAGIYTGGFTMINADTGLPNPLRADMGSCGNGATASSPPIPEPIDCPAGYAVVRAGFNNDTMNAYSIYRVNSFNGQLTLLPNGPLYYPGSTRPLQVNGIGANRRDRKFYGLATEGQSTTVRLVRFDEGYSVTLLGNIPPPPAPAGYISFVNSAAGTMDNNDNFYFTAAKVKPGTAPGTIILEKLYLGKIPDVSTITGPVSPVYREVEWSNGDCGDFIQSLRNDPVNSGVKDLFYHPVTRTFFTYVTYRNNPSSSSYKGQMIELKKSGHYNLKYRMHCKNVINQHQAEASGTMLGSDGKFLVLLTDGTIGYIKRSGNSDNYNGYYAELNDSTGLATVNRGDLASCITLSHPGHGDGEEDDRAAPTSFRFTLQPNPVDRVPVLTLRWTNTEQPVLVDITVYDSYGTIVRTLANVTASEGQTMSINVANLVGGIYYVKAYDRKSKKSFQLRFLRL